MSLPYLYPQVPVWLVLAPDTPCINYHQAVWRISSFKGLMIHQQYDNVRLIKCILDIYKRDAFQCWRQHLDIWLNCQNLTGMAVNQLFADCQRWAFTQVINIRFEGQAETRDCYLFGCFVWISAKTFTYGFTYLVYHPLRLAIIDFPRGANQTSLVRRLADNEPRVNRNTVTAHPRSRLKDVDPWMPVSQRNEFPYIDIKLVTDNGKLIGKGNIHIAEAVFRQLCHLCSTGIGGNTLSFQEGAVESTSGRGAFRRHAADDPIIMDKLTQYVAGQYTLWAMGDADIRIFAVGLGEGQIGTCFGQPLRHLLCSPHWRGGLQHHQVALDQYRRDSFGSGFDIAEIGIVVVILEWRWYCDQEGVCRFRSRGRTQVALGNSRMYDHVQIRFDNMDLALVDGIYSLLVYVNADNLDFTRSEHSSSGQAYVAQADHGDGVVLHRYSLVVLVPIVQGLGNALAGLAIPIGVMSAGHGSVRLLIGQQEVEIVTDSRDFGPNQLDGTCLNSLRAFGGVAHDQYRFTQGGSFFLDTTGVGEDDMSAIHQVNKRQVIQRLDEVYVVDTLQQTIDRLTYIGVEVDRIKNFNVGVGLGSIYQRLADALEATTEAFPAVAGDKDQLFFSIQEIELVAEALLQLLIAFQLGNDIQ